MCVGGSPSAPPPPPPPKPPAEVKMPETVQAVRDKRKATAAGMDGGTLLTGQGGVAPTSLNVSKPTLLGQ